MPQKNIPFCPLMSAGNSVEVVCTEERCAWYLKNYKMCAMYIMAYNSAMEIQSKQSAKRK